MFWSGDEIRGDSDAVDNKLAYATYIDTVEIAIAYCNADMTWMFQDVLRQIPDNIKKIKITVLSKCGHDEKDVPRFHDVDHRVSKADVNVISLANVGGCDYAYAHFLNRYIDRNISKKGSNMKSPADSSAILFIKDSPRDKSYLHMPHHERYRSINEMIQIASTRGFSCGAKTECDVSTFHDTATLYNFTKANYVRNSEILKGASRHVIQPEFNTANYTNLRDFHMRALDWTFPNVDGVTEGCYGGTFTVLASKVMELSNVPKVRRAMNFLEDNLQRNTTTTIEEHFAERTWAGLLTNPLSDEQTHRIQIIGENMIKDKGQIFGALKADKYATCSGFQLYKKYCKRRWCSLWSR